MSHVSAQRHQLTAIDGVLQGWQHSMVLVLDEAAAGVARAARESSTAPSNNEVLSRWRRSERLGVIADAHAYPEGTSDSDLASRRARLADVFREEGALLGPIAAGLAERALVALIADPDGVILASHGGGDFLDPAARVRLVCGARWSEEARGTNAIGTALVEARAVAVIGCAHYEERNRGLFCYATPLRDPFGELVAVLDVTGPMLAHDPSVGVAVQAASAGIERSLRTLAYAQAGASMLRNLERLAHSSNAPTFLCDPDGQLRVVSSSAREELGLDAHTQPTCEQIFGVTYTVLLRAALEGERSHFETPQASYDVFLDPLLTTSGRALGLTIRLERRGPKTPTSIRPPRSTPQASASLRDSLPSSFDPIFAEDPHVRQAKGAAWRFAQTELPVLLLAETGTGKELFARAIHDSSARSSGPFVAVNCGAFTEGLLESELFGYAPHSFTGAAREGAMGKLASAHGGTLFLDELGEMPSKVQAVLLRVLDDGSYTRVGEARPRQANFRLICATCKDLPSLVSQGRFRQDLLYRVCHSPLFC